MMLVKLLSLKTRHQIGIATAFRVTSMFSMRAVSLASSQHCRSADADAQRIWALRSTMKDQKDQVEIKVLTPEQVYQHP